MQTSPPSSLRVLVVEDDPVTQRILAHVLKARGHETILCGCAEQAQEEMTRHFYPLIILDWVLPGMNGTLSKPAKRL